MAWHRRHAQQLGNRRPRLAQPPRQIREFEPLGFVDVPNRGRVLLRAELDGGLTAPFAARIGNRPPRGRTTSGSMIPFSEVEPTSPDRRP